MPTALANDFIFPLILREAIFDIILLLILRLKYVIFDVILLLILKTEAIFD